MKEEEGAGPARHEAPSPPWRTYHWCLKYHTSGTNVDSWSWVIIWLRLIGVGQVSGGCQGVLQVDRGIRAVGGPAGWTGVSRARDSGLKQTAPWWQRAAEKQGFRNCEDACGLYVNFSGFII